MLIPNNRFLYGLWASRITFHDYHEPLLRFRTFVLRYNRNTDEYQTFLSNRIHKPRLMIVSLSICAFKKQLNDNGNQAEEDSQAGEDNQDEEDNRAGEDSQDEEDSRVVGGIQAALRNHNTKESVPFVETITWRKPHCLMAVFTGRFISIFIHQTKQHTGIARGQHLRQRKARSTNCGILQLILVHTTYNHELQSVQLEFDDRIRIIVRYGYILVPH